MGHSHPFTPAARGSLNHDGEAVLFAEDSGGFNVGDILCARHYGHFVLDHGFAGDRFVAHKAHTFGTRTYEGDAMFGADFGKIGALGQEPVAWMISVVFGELSGGYDLGYI